ncbi:N-lysine methyltransferase [Acrasis kona]|uniref:N-lysine methyltransferase n=1 Tax=Acrasis kona TaxID=1008807 RepID=A0AAW2YID3_9EUKA
MKQKQQVSHNGSNKRFKPNQKYDKTLDYLNSWMEKKGITWKQSIIVRKDASGHSVFATRDLKEDEIVCTVPKTAILSRKTSPLRDIIDEEELAGGMALTLCLMYEMTLKKKSEWWPYLQSLPQVVDLPMYWDEQALTHLEGTCLDPSTIVEENALLLEDYQSIIKPLFRKHAIFNEGKYMNFESYRRAAGLVASRAFSVDDFHDLSMVPLCDIFNHKSGSENVHMECQAEVCLECGSEDHVEHDAPTHDEHVANVKSISMTTNSDIKCKSELFNVYEDLSNVDLLLKYGYAHENNPFDVVSIKPDVIHNAIHDKKWFDKNRWEYWLSIKNTKLEEEEEENEEEDDGDEEDEELHCEFNAEGKPNHTLLLLLCIMFAKKEQYASWKNVKKLIQHVKSQAVTKQMKEACVIMAKERLSIYKDSLDEDLEGLQDKHLPSRHKWSLIIKVCEKRILHKVVEE